MGGNISMEDEGTAGNGGYRYQVHKNIKNIIELLCFYCKLPFLGCNVKQNIH